MQLCTHDLLTKSNLIMFQLQFHYLPLYNGAITLEIRFSFDPTWKHRLHTKVGSHLGIVQQDFYIWDTLSSFDVTILRDTLHLNTFSAVTTAQTGECIKDNVVCHTCRHLTRVKCDKNGFSVLDIYQLHVTSVQAERYILRFPRWHDLRVNSTAFTRCNFLRKCT